MNEPEKSARNKREKLVALLDAVDAPFQGSEYLDKGGWKVSLPLEAGPKEWDKNWDKGWNKWGK
jgi:hypothetical protein